MRIRTETVVERRTLAITADTNEVEPMLIPGLGSSSCSSSSGATR